MYPLRQPLRIGTRFLPLNIIQTDGWELEIRKLVLHAAEACP